MKYEDGRRERESRLCVSCGMSADDLAFDALCSLCEGQDISDGLEQLRPVARRALGDFLISNAERVDEKVLSAIDAAWAAAKSNDALSPTPEALADGLWLRVGKVDIGIWRGDICKLRVGALVNAANEGGLGCFQPSHRCIDNVLHRAAGPRLREACRELMQTRRTPLSAGSPPLLTPGYHLFAQHVLHVTGPCLQPRGRQPTAEERATLARCYTGCLQAAAEAGIRSIAFCCLSAGLFGYPSRDAAAVALSTVSGWIREEPSRSALFDAIIFDVFTEEDERSYRSQAADLLFSLPSGDANTLIKEDADTVNTAAAAAAAAGVERAAHDIAGATHLLIVAAAGLSISRDLPNNPYHSNDDFAYHYPAAVRYGYQNGFEAMGLSADARVPLGVRVAHTARHFLNMRFRFPPTKGYEQLHTLASTFPAEHVFVWTSNVDGCFERSGFDRTRVYTTQGEMDKYQCTRCGNVWRCEDQLRAIDQAAVDGVLTDLSLGLSCPRCGATFDELLPNLRGGDWFNHTPYDETSRRLVAWLDGIVASKASVAVLEIGVGPNTPVVTRIPACAFASAVALSGGSAAYVRINPDPPEGASENPSERVRFHRFRQTWAALEPLVQAAVHTRSERVAHRDRGALLPLVAPVHVSAGPSDSRRGQRDEEGGGRAWEGGGLQMEPAHEAAAWTRRYRELLSSLRRPPVPVQGARSVGPRARDR
jgi:O-acetyl-ADP-ribose deacetylase (regulator of RNase III)/NAD-dependent SIR2 family protein deacetylase